MVLTLACSGKVEKETGAAVRAPTAAAGAGAGEYTGADQNQSQCYQQTLIKKIKIVDILPKIYLFY